MSASANIKAAVVAMLTVIVVSTMLSACTRELDPIRYGTDAGSYCRMTIVEPRFAGSILTEKGRTLKFDAIECMANYVIQEEGNGASFSPDQVYVSVNEQGDLWPVSKAYFVIIENVRTPMGGGIVAYNNDQANSTTWLEILDLYRRNSETKTRH